MNITPKKVSKLCNYNEDESEGEISDSGLKIVIESPHSKRKINKIELEPDEKEIIEGVENEIDNILEEKAAKINLTTNNVKNILKHVVTNEHVLAMVRQTENPESEQHTLVFEPKLTRAKAKELFSSQQNNTLSWIKSKPKQPSEVDVLISEELQEDSSGDEYVPAEEESEDDRESSVTSELDILPVTPQTPINCDTSTQTNWTEDGVFKIPPAKTKEEEEEEANIARRTRSKLSLSATPLEVIEESFIPPDITTDMYDIDCDDDEWKDFLKKFTRPLDEVTKPAEDEEHDPEYNILADEEIDKVDREELRADKGVKVTRKELNELIAELFDFADNYTNNMDQNTLPVEEEPQYRILKTPTEFLKEAEKSDTSEIQMEIQECEENETSKLTMELLETDQIYLLNQQLHQHVQLLTQTFLTTYQHPEFSDIASKCKENLLSFKYLSENKSFSLFATVNLHPALKLIEDWEIKLNSNDEEAVKTKDFVVHDLLKVKENGRSGCEYIPTFPKLIFETISKSAVFIYPDLIPRIPFKPSCSFKKKFFIPSEDELIALGLEQFIPFLKEIPQNCTRKGEVELKSLCFYLTKYLLPPKDIGHMYYYIIRMKSPKFGPNPIKYYYENKSAPFTVHLVHRLDCYGVIAPYQRDFELLPYQWKKYLNPDFEKTVQNSNCGDVIPVNPLCLNLINLTPVDLLFASKGQRIAPKPTPISFFKAKSFKSTRYKRYVKRTHTSKNVPKKLENFFKSPTQQKLSNAVNSSIIKNFKFNSSIFKGLKRRNLQDSFNMLPSMPLLGTSLQNSDESVSKSQEKVMCNSEVVFERSEEPQIDEIVNETVQQPVVEIIDEENYHKDNPDDINAFMVASSTMKNSNNKRGSVITEKKRAKMKKDFNSKLILLTPDSPGTSEEKTNSYVQAYYDKVCERLDDEEYQNVMEILSNHNEKEHSTPELYKRIENVLSPKHSDLLEEFLTFLTPADAQNIGKLMPHFMLTNMSLFLRKLEIYFKDQPAQVRKIYRSLTELATCVDVTMEHVKKTILPLLKGNNLLTDWFLQIFPVEKPTKTLLNGAWETIDSREFKNSDGSDPYEVINIPDTDDPFGGPNCKCTCHEVEDDAFKSRSRHCVPCGIKFYQGRVYMQTGKILRSANVTFGNGLENDQIQRLNCKSTIIPPKRNNDSSPNKHLNISPNKDGQDEVRVSNDSEDDGDGTKKKTRKTPRKSRVKARDQNLKEDKGETSSNIESYIKTIEETVEYENKKCQNEVEPCAVKVENQQDEPPLENISDTSKLKQSSDETMEWDCNTSIESIELKLSPEHSADSGSEFCEESSQDNENSESDDTSEDLGSISNSPPHSENSNSNNTFEEVSWTRDEDKIILETFQKEPDSEKAFSCIAELLSNRTITQIKQRFETLMNLLQEMAASSNE